MDKNYRLETERTLLTLLTEEDLPAMEELAREPDTFKYIKKLEVMTPEEYTRFLHLKLQQIREKKGYHWAVWLKMGTGAQAHPRTDGTSHLFIGAINLNPIGSTGRLQIGAQLKRDYWGQGFASELMARLVQFAIDELKLPAVYGVFEKENIVSRRLLKKLGFVFEKSILDKEVELESHQYPPPAPDSHPA